MLIDLVVPYWGEPRYLRELVASVLAQTDPRWRLTVVDDAYPDPWAEEYLADLGDERIAYVRNAANRGITDVFQQCADLVRGEIAAFPGCDDLLLPDYVTVVLDAHERFGEADIIQPGVRVVDGQGRHVAPLADVVKQRLLRPGGREPRMLGGEPLATGLLHGDWLYWPSLAFRREALRRTRFRPGLPIVLDLALVLDLVCAGSRLLVDPRECFAYRRHATSASSTTAVDGVRFRGEREFFDLAARQMAALGWTRAARAARLHVTSRVHALTLLPSVLRHRDASAGVLLRHALRP